MSTDTEVEDQFGVPSKEIAKNILIYSQSADFLDDRDIALEYEGKWVGAYLEEIIAVADDLDTLLKKIDDLKISRALTAVEFFEPANDKRILIL